jgi:hypothetical protein
MGALDPQPASFGKPLTGKSEPTETGLSVADVMTLSSKAEGEG